MNLDQLYNQDLEGALIGAILINPETVLEVMDIVSAKDFHTERARYVYRTITCLVEIDEPVAMEDILLQAKKEKAKRPARDKLAIYLSQCVTDYYRLRDNAATFAELVKLTAQKRGMITLAEALANLAVNPSDEAAISAAEKAKELLEE